MISYAVSVIPVLLALSTASTQASDIETTPEQRLFYDHHVAAGQYSLHVIVNGQPLIPSISLVTFHSIKSDSDNGKANISQACFLRDMVSLMGLTTVAFDRVLWSAREKMECADFRQLPGIVIKPDLFSGVLNITIPEVWLKYIGPPEDTTPRWDNGISGLLFDYSADASATPSQEREQSRNLHFKGTAGVNVGAWRFRAEYLGDIKHSEGRRDNRFIRERVYVYRSLPELNSKLTLGDSYIAHEKRFDDARADVTFTGYRFSELEYKSQRQHLNPSYRGNVTSRVKELYTATLNKHFEGNSRTSVELQLSHQTYRDDPDRSNYFTVGMKHYTSIGDFHGVSIGLSVSRTRHYDEDNESVYLSVTVPTGKNRAGNGSINRAKKYRGILNDGLDSYNINVNGREQFSGNYIYSGAKANMTTNLSMSGERHNSVGINLAGGTTLTAKGMALHAGNVKGGTRLLIDTGGMSGAPVNDGRYYTNWQGVGVVTDIENYYRSIAQPKTEPTMTEGAIGYHKLE